MNIKLIASYWTASQLGTVLYMLYEKLNLVDHGKSELYLGSMNEQSTLF